MLVAAHLALPLGIAVALPVAMAGGARPSWSGAGLACWLGGVALAYVHDRAVPSRCRHDHDGNALRSRALSRGRSAMLTVGALATLFLAGGVLAAPTRLGPPVLALGLIVIAYPLASRVAAGKTVAVAACWTWGAASLPADNLEPPALVLAAVFALVAAGAILCDLKDAEGDRAAGVRSLAVVLGARGARRVAGCLAVIGGATALASGAAMPLTSGAALPLASGAVLLAATGIALVAAAALPRVVGRSLVGPVVVDGALALPALALLA